jgi:glutamate formiminotransferase / 5-formyltetrahydrofolate cyclo-ligase
VQTGGVFVECVVNISEGRDERTLGELAEAAGPRLIHRHSDPEHHRSVLTLAGAEEDIVEAVRSLATAAVSRLDLRAHQGAHPRLGVLDVVPFVPYDPGRPPPRDLAAVVPLRDDFARWVGQDLGVPSFLYGPLPGGQNRTLPQVRQHAFAELAPDFGPGQPHRSAGATVVGARGALVAYNVWVSPGAGAPVTAAQLARLVAPRVRGPLVRALGLEVGGGGPGDRAQVSCNLIDPANFGPAQLYDAAAAEAGAVGGGVAGGELVGLLPRSVLEEIPKTRWVELGLSEDLTIEARLG